MDSLIVVFFLDFLLIKFFWKIKIIEDCEDRFSTETLREMIYMIGVNLPIPGKVVRRLESGNEPTEEDEVLTFIHYETDPKKKNILSENVH